MNTASMTSLWIWISARRHSNFVRLL